MSTVTTKPRHAGYSGRYDDRTRFEKETAISDAVQRLSYCRRCDRQLAGHGSTWTDSIDKRTTCPSGLPHAAAHQ